MKYFHEKMSKDEYQVYDEENELIIEGDTIQRVKEKIEEYHISKTQSEYEGSLNAGDEIVLPYDIFKATENNTEFLEKYEAYYIEENSQEEEHGYLIR